MVGSDGNIKMNKLLKQYVCNYGNLHVFLGKGKINVVRVHRLVCYAYHGPPNNRDDVVNHINERKHDKRSINLEWCTRSENIAYSLGYNVGVDYENNQSDYFDSIKYASKFLGISYTTLY